ncbi:MAG: hypothetical protein HC859_09315 [Bacteroidia bacterium]|nr:hypothetical protein [Bacteroidia bacterium]
MKLLVLLLVICASGSAAGQKNEYKGMPSLVWPKLYDITFTKAKDDLGEFDKPVFSASAKSLDGKSVILPGYMLPFEGGVKGTHFMLSSLPVNACFFCGVGGPESVVEVFLQEPITFTEKPIEIKGTLRLNATDPEKMIYVLENATFEGTVDF